MSHYVLRKISYCGDGTEKGATRFATVDEAHAYQTYWSAYGYEVVEVKEPIESKKKYAIRAINVTGSEWWVYIGDILKKSDLRWYAKDRTESSSIQLLNGFIERYKEMFPKFSFTVVEV